MTVEIQPRYGGEVIVESTTEGLRLTVSDHTDAEVATVYLSSADARWLADALTAGGA